MTDSASIPALEFIFAAHVTVDPALDLGDVGKGGRRIVPVAERPIGAGSRRLSHGILRAFAITRLSRAPLGAYISR